MSHFEVLSVKSQNSYQVPGLRPPGDPKGPSPEGQEQALLDPLAVIGPQIIFFFKRDPEFTETLSCQECKSVASLFDLFRMTLPRGLTWSLTGENNVAQVCMATCTGS